MGEDIPYIVTRKKVKNINFRFSDEGVLKVSAPYRVSEAVVLSAVEKNKNAIYKVYSSMQKKKHFSLKDDDFENGREIYFWGKPVKLKFDEGISKSFYREGILYIKEDILSPLHLRKKALMSFLNKEAEDFLLDVSGKIYSSFFKDRVPCPTYSFKSLKSRWGSCCKAKNLITYNFNLVFLPKEFAVYVAVHEFCHLIVFDHSKAFYAEVAKIMPDYRRIKDIQKEYTF